MAIDPNNLYYDLNAARVLLELGKKQLAKDIIEDIQAKDPNLIDKVFNSNEKQLFIEVIEMVEQWRV